MSKLFKVIADQLAAARFDDRLNKEEGALLEALSVALDAFGRGKDLWAYCRENDAHEAKEEAALAKPKAVKSRRRGKAKKRDARKMPESRRAA